MNRGIREINERMFADGKVHTSLSEEEIKYIIQNTKDVAVEYTEHPHASLAIIHKN